MALEVFEDVRVDVNSKSVKIEYSCGTFSFTFHTREIDINMLQEIVVTMQAAIEVVKGVKSHMATRKKTMVEL